MLVLTFERAGVAIATRTIRGQVTTATGFITVTDQGGTGEATTVVLSSGGAFNETGTVTHTDSMVQGSATFNLIPDTGGEGEIL